MNLYCMALDATVLSSVGEDYLEQIYQLIEAKGYARAVEIATKLEVSQASVSAMVQRLAAEGFIHYERYRGITLTDAGRKAAQKIIQRHEVLTRLFAYFGLDEELIYRDVEGMEHHISPQTLQVLTLLTEELEGNPQMLARLKRRLRQRKE
ncbi:MAG: transcriptional regulator MntR [Verrucomicrobia bacterium]|nr:MAG: transcriptional regulator MntR [Verrucomicrobiota bacterium]